MYQRKPLCRRDGLPVGVAVQIVNAILVVEVEDDFAVDGGNPCRRVGEGRHVLVKALLSFLQRRGGEGVGDGWIKDIRGEDGEWYVWMTIEEVTEFLGFLVL